MGYIFEESHNVRHGHATGFELQNHLVNACPPGFVFGDVLRFETVISVTRDFDLYGQLSKFTFEGLLVLVVHQQAIDRFVRDRGLYCISIGVLQFSAS
jgi:hypothetical protein